MSSYSSYYTTTQKPAITYGSPSSARTSSSSYAYSNQNPSSYYDSPRTSGTSLSSRANSDSSSVYDNYSRNTHTMSSKYSTTGSHSSGGSSSRDPRVVQDRLVRDANPPYNTDRSRYDGFTATDRTTSSGRTTTYNYGTGRYDDLEPRSTDARSRDYYSTQPHR